MSRLSKYMEEQYGIQETHPRHDPQLFALQDGTFPRHVVIISNRGRQVALNVEAASGKEAFDAAVRWAQAKYRRDASWLPVFVQMSTADTAL